MNKPLKVFYSYSHDDEDFLVQLKKHLAPLRHDNLIVDWYDRMILPGSNWELLLTEKIEEADLFIMLVSSSFLSSSYCFNIEMKRALERAQKNEAIIVPVIIRECLWNITPFQRIQALPKDGIPIKSWNDRDKAWKNVVTGLYERIKSANNDDVNVDMKVEDKKSQGEIAITQNLKVVRYTNPHVFGREGEIKFLMDSLVNATKPTTITSGFGGIGKSTLALKVAWIFLENKSPFNFIGFINCRTSGTDEKQGISYNDILNEIARLVGRKDIVSNTNPEAKAEQIRDMLQSYKALLIFDNYESLLQYPDQERRISEFIKSLPTGSAHNDYSLTRVIITTRELSPGLKSLPSNVLNVEKMPLDACVEWMKHITPQNIVLEDVQYRKIWEMLYGLPKYIEIAMVHLKTIPFDDLGKMYTRIREKTAMFPTSGSPIYDLYNDLFEISWNNGLDYVSKCVLMSMSYFGDGDAPSEALKHVSGVSEEDFETVLTSISTAYLESTGSMLHTHPLTSAYCQSKLNSDDFAVFRGATQRRFIEYYRQFVENVGTDGQVKEIRNIVSAVHLAKDLKEWNTIVEMEKRIEVRFQGYWYQQLDISEYAAEASRKLGLEKRLADLLVNNIGWLYLRLERIQEAIAAVSEGLEIYKRLDDRVGVAQASRHLGKAALIKGLDEYYVPNSDFDTYGTQAQGYYEESLSTRKKLADQGIDQREAIADMYLDFGRLYWLQGMRLEQIGHENDDPNMLSQALQKYYDANRISLDAQRLFEKIKVDRGIVKSWGNLGNATKEIVKYALCQKDWGVATYNIEKAHEYYAKNAEGGTNMKRIDEVSHGFWGLAEIYKIYAATPSLHKSTEKKESLIRKALWYAEESNKIYTSLGGTKDINATRALVGELQVALNAHEVKKARKEGRKKHSV